MTIEIDVKRLESEIRWIRDAAKGVRAAGFSDLPEAIATGLDHVADAFDEFIGVLEDAKVAE